MSFCFHSRLRRVSFAVFSTILFSSSVFSLEVVCKRRHRHESTSAPDSSCVRFEQCAPSWAQFLCPTGTFFDDNGQLSHHAIDQGLRAPHAMRWSSGNEGFRSLSIDEVLHAGRGMGVVSAYGSEDSSQSRALQARARLQVTDSQYNSQYIGQLEELEDEQSATEPGDAMVPSAQSFTDSVRSEGVSDYYIQTGSGVRALPAASAAPANREAVSGTMPGRVLWPLDASTESRCHEYYNRHHTPESDRLYLRRGAEVWALPELYSSNHSFTDDFGEGMRCFAHMSVSLIRSNIHGAGQSIGEGLGGLAVLLGETVVASCRTVMNHRGHSWESMSASASAPLRDAAYELMNSIRQYSPDMPLCLSERAMNQKICSAAPAVAQQVALLGYGGIGSLRSLARSVGRTAAAAEVAAEAAQPCAAGAVEVSRAAIPSTVPPVNPPIVPTMRAPTIPGPPQSIGAAARTTLPGVGPVQSVGTMPPAARVSSPSSLGATSVEGRPAIVPEAPAASRLSRLPAGGGVPPGGGFPPELQNPHARPGVSLPPSISPPAPPSFASGWQIVTDQGLGIQISDTSLLVLPSGVNITIGHFAGQIASVHVFILASRRSIILRRALRFSQPQMEGGSLVNVSRSSPASRIEGPNGRVYSVDSFEFLGDRNLLVVLRSPQLPAKILRVAVSDLIRGL